MPKCKGCGREIIFVRSVKGKMIPCDPGMITFYPDEKNGDQVYVDTEGRVVKGYPKEDGSFCGGFGDWAARHGYISHFATCPQAERFRRRGG